MVELTYFRDKPGKERICAKNESVSEPEGIGFRSCVRDSAQPIDGRLCDPCEGEQGYKGVVAGGGVTLGSAVVVLPSRC